MSIKNYLNKIPKSIIALIVILVALNVTFFYFSPNEIIERVGVQNAYLLVFSIAAIGGLSSFTSTALYSSIATFASGGATA